MLKAGAAVKSKPNHNKNLKPRLRQRHHHRHIHKAVFDNIHKYGHW